MNRTYADDVEALLRQLIATGQSVDLRPVLQRYFEGRAPEAIDQVLATLKEVSEQHLIGDTRAALLLADALVLGAELTEQPRHRALGLLARADAMRVQGHYPAAVAGYEQAGSMCLALGDRVTWARTRTGWVLSMHYLGRGREALTVAEAAESVLLDAREWLRAGGLNLNTGLVCYELGDYARSLELYERALGLYERARLERPALAPLADERSARARANMAVNEALLGNFDRAIALYEEARGVFVRHAEHDAALRVDHYLAALYAGQGQYTRALRVHADALVAAERAGLADTVVEVSLEMARAYAGLNRHADALEVAERLAERCEQGGSPTEAAKARFACAQSLAALGQHERALEALAAAATTFADAGLQSELAASALLRARIHLAERDWSASLAEAEAARELLAERGVLVPRVQVELTLARASLGLAQPARATEHARNALDLSTERSLLPLCQDAHHVLARAADATGNRSEALAAYALAIGDLERVQSRLATELRIDFLGDKLQVFFDAIECCLRAGDATAAFGYLERAKSRALVDYLVASPDVRVGARDATEQGLIDELSDLRNEHHWFVSRLHGLSVEPPAESERATLQASIGAREKRIAAVLERLALSRSAEGLETLGERPHADTPRVPTVPEGTVLLQYLLRPDRGFVFIVSERGLRVQELTVGAREVQRLMRLWYLNLDSVGRAIASRQPLDRLIPNARGILSALYRALVAPAAAALHGMQRLIVVPFGPAHAVPFHALFDGQRHLIEYLQVSTSPSSAVLELCQRRPDHAGRGALVIGHSSGGQLTHVTDEARWVADLLQASCYLEDEATRALFMAAAPQHGIVHIAAHGESRLDNPLFAHIALADGQLGTQDVFNLRLDGALVTLSACETGRSAVVGGDELVGLSRGFLFAGAATLVQSLWRVDDAATARLMASFYTGVVDGHSPGAALRAAQCELLAEGTHPHTWAAFQLVGRDDLARCKTSNTP